MPKILVFIMICLFASLLEGSDNWPDFRGPAKDGHSDAVDLPLTWSETENVKWKIPIHDRGWSTPVIWGDQIWLTTATEDGQSMFAVCVSKDSGKILYDVRIFENDNPPRIASLNSYASPSPVIDEDRVYIHFGTFGTACLDTKSGSVIWQRRDLHCDHEEGPGSSPVLFGDLVIITMDGGDIQYLVALNKNTGETIWKTHRSTDWPEENDYRLAFGTPLIVDVNEKKQLVSTGSKAVMAYDPFTGKEIWQVRYAGWSNSSRPVAENGLVFINTGFDDPQLWAVKPDGRGDVSESHVVWKCRENVPKIPSPVIVNGLIYMVNDNGYVSCMEAVSGETVWKARITGKYMASPLYASGRIYISNHKGKTTIIKPGRSFQILAANELEDGFMASPAVSGDLLFLRSKKHLYCIKKSGKN